VAVHWLWTKPSPVNPIPAANVAPREFALVAPGRNPPAPTTTAHVSNRFEWAKIESTEWAELMAHLRAVGCPEKTIRDVVGARARRALERLARSAPQKLPFWAGGSRRARADRAAERIAGAAREQIYRRAEQAVGRDTLLDDGKLEEDFVEQALARFITGPMPEETFWRLAAACARDTARRNELQAHNLGVWLAEDDRVLERIRAQYQSEVAAVLSPAQLEEFRARAAMLKGDGEVLFEATDLTATDARQIALRVAQFKEIPTLKDWFAGPDPNAEQQAELQAEVREYLGAARFAQFERAADDDFKSLFTVVRNQNLPADAAVAAYEIRRLTVQEITRLRDDPSLTDVQREERLAQVQESAAVAVVQALGTRAIQEYLARGGSWLTNVNGL
jgi:hypothetical protein